MRKPAVVALSTLIGLSAANLVWVEDLHAGGFNPMNMVNPSRWFGDRYDDYDDYRYGNRYGYPPGYYGAPYGAPFGAPGYAAPGYGVPLYGAPGISAQSYAPVQTQSPPAVTGSDASAERIRELEERIRQLEAPQKQAPQKPIPSYQPSAPVFRPIDQPGTEG